MLTTPKKDEKPIQKKAKKRPTSKSAPSSTLKKTAKSSEPARIKDYYHRTEEDMLRAQKELEEIIAKQNKPRIKNISELYVPGFMDDMTADDIDAWIRMVREGRGI